MKIDGCVCRSGNRKIKQKNFTKEEKVWNNFERLKLIGELLSLMLTKVRFRKNYLLQCLSRVLTKQRSSCDFASRYKTNFENNFDEIILSFLSFYFPSI